MNMGIFIMVMLILFKDLIIYVIVFFRLCYLRFFFSIRKYKKFN